MAERRPPGFNVDLGFYDSDEVLSIPRKIRAAAIGVWTLCGSYSANKLTDGYVSAEALRDRGCTPAIRAALIASTLWESADAGAIWFTRWAKWQRTCAEVKAYRGSEVERKRKARAAKRAALTSEDAETSARTLPGPSQRVQQEDRDPKTKTETETKEKEKTCATKLRDRPPLRFDEFWIAYPRRRDRRKAERAFAAALKRADADTIIAGARRYATDPNRDDQFTKYAEGWLNGDGWLDEPLPPRNGNHGPPIATSDLRVAQVQALKSVPSPRLELE